MEMAVKKKTDTFVNSPRDIREGCETEDRQICKVFERNDGRVRKGREGVKSEKGDNRLLSTRFEEEEHQKSQESLGRWVVLINRGV